MKKGLLVLALVAAVSSQAFGQGGLRLDMIAAPVKFTAGGEKQLFNTPMITGAVIDYNLFGMNLSTGFYGTFSVNTLEMDEVKLGGMLHTKIYKGMGVGVWYDFWKDGKGLVKPTAADDNWGFALGVDFTLGTKAKKQEK